MPGFSVSMSGDDYHNLEIVSKIMGMSVPVATKFLALVAMTDEEVVNKAVYMRNRKASKKNAWY